MKDDRPDTATPDMPRRNFLKLWLAGTCGTLLPAVLQAYPRVPYRYEDYQWGFIVDLGKCMGCGACVRACKAENNVPDKLHRTWVERYTTLRDGKVEVDSPMGALHGFPNEVPHPPEEVAKSFFVPKLCNHCETSPCVQVCPVGASYDSPDGVVLVDYGHCIGCGYCVQACPYGCRFIDHDKGYADKCTLCYHRIRKGLAPACVVACPVNARDYGNLKDPSSRIRRLQNTSRYGVLKPALGTHPKCFYIGLDQEVV
jgi:Fe-S-cluster-containing dehydrogenase component